MLSLPRLTSFNHKKSRMFPKTFILTFFQLSSSDLIGWNRLGNNIARHETARRNIRCNQAFRIVLDKNVVEISVKNARKRFRRRRGRICW